MQDESWARLTLFSGVKFQIIWRLFFHTIGAFGTGSPVIRRQKWPGGFGDAKYRGKNGRHLIWKLRARNENYPVNGISVSCADPIYKNLRMIS